MACPLCGVDFDDAMVLRLHLVHQHGLRDDVFPDPTRALATATGSGGCGGSPIPQLTLTALLFVYLVVVDGLVPSPWTIPGLWVGFGLYGAAMYKAMWDRRAT